MAIHLKTKVDVYSAFHINILYISNMLDSAYLQIRCRSNFMCFFHVYIYIYLYTIYSHITYSHQSLIPGKSQETTTALPLLPRNFAKELSEPYLPR